MKTFWEFLAEIAPARPFQPTPTPIQSPEVQKLQAGKQISPEETRAMERIRSVIPQLQTIQTSLNAKDIPNALTEVQRLQQQVQGIKLPQPILNLYNGFIQLMGQLELYYRDRTRQPMAPPQHELNSAVSGLNILMQNIQPPQQQAG